MWKWLGGVVGVVSTLVGTINLVHFSSLNRQRTHVLVYFKKLCRVKFIMTFLYLFIFGERTAVINFGF